MFLFTCIVSLFVATVRISSAQCEGPLGVILCKVHCTQIKGCHQYSLDPTSLTCCIGRNDTDLQNESEVLITIKKKRIPVSIERCTRGSRIFRTRKNRLHCLKEEKNSTAGGTRNGTSSHTMFYVNVGGTGRMYILNLTSGLVHRYPNLLVSGICAMAYNKFSNTLYYASRFSRRIAKTVLSTPDRFIIKRNIKVTTMAIDEGNELLFVSDKKCIVGTLEDIKYTKMFKTKVQVDYIAVVPKQRTIYLSCKYVIYVSTYEGVRSRMVKRTGFGPMTIDLQNNLLFYCSYMNFLVYNLTSRTKVWNTFMMGDATGVGLDDGFIYVTLKGPVVYIISEVKGHYENIRTINLDVKYSTIVSVIV